PPPTITTRGFVKAVSFLRESIGAVRSYRRQRTPLHNRTQRRGLLGPKAVQLRRSPSVPTTRRCCCTIRLRLLVSFPGQNLMRMLFQLPEIFPDRDRRR